MSDRVTWITSGQIDGGKRVNDEIQAPEESSKEYLLHRFLARHKSLTTYWLSHNQGFTCRIKGRENASHVDPLLKKRRKPSPEGEMTNWPAVRPGWREGIRSFVRESIEDGQIIIDDRLMETDYGMRAAIIAANGKIYTGHNHLHAYLSAAKDRGFMRLGIPDELSIQDDDWSKMSEVAKEGFLHAPTNQFYDREKAYDYVTSLGHDKFDKDGTLDSEDLKPT